MVRPSRQMEPVVVVSAGVGETKHELSIIPDGDWVRWFLGVFIRLCKLAAKNWVRLVISGLTGMVASCLQSAGLAAEVQV
jgi:hypothetical protein